VADHLRGATFLIADGVRPLNVGRGYVLRRILRRAVLHGRLLDIGGYFLREPAEKVIELYGGVYPELREKEKEILALIHEEEEKFGKTLSRGLKEFKKMGQKIDAFTLYDTYGFPLEMTKELARSEGLKIDEKDFEKKLAEQQARARAALKDKKIADELIAPQHTAAHLLNSALKQVLGPQVRQAGQHLKEGEFRHDFTFGRKLTQEEVERVEDLVNKKIVEKIPILKKETSLGQAKEEGAEAVFAEKYQELDQVTVYQVGDSPESVFSKELCGGPHVKNTSELGKFAIIKEEAAGAGVRRIYAKAVLSA
jgi:alanyl-tRNA synthetase